MSGGVNRALGGPVMRWLIVNTAMGVLIVSSTGPRAETSSATAATVVAGEPARFTVFFGFDRVELDPAGQQVDEGILWAGLDLGIRF